ncbi:MAG: hypothetical protein KME08_10810 [Aphanothece sp. CMT-3BRIN-NPC111]|jgi:hypothetical protein|nr:hypothetical protein [Aphanothece sp. CMT-3BRIN-NPC111]
MKKLALILILLIAGTSAAVYYYYLQQATKLPDWYTSKKETTAALEIKDTEYISESQARNAQTITDKTEPFSKRKRGKSVEINLNEDDINNLIMSGFTKNTYNKNLPEAIKGVNTNIKDGKIESGAIVNISKIQTAPTANNDKLTITQLTKTFPFLVNQEVYVGVVGKPTVENGQLKLGDDTEIKVGNLSFPISEVSNKLGIPKEQLEKRINQELKLRGVKVEDVELVDNNMLLKGSSK